MNGLFAGLGPQVVILLSAGLISSLGITWAARAPRGSAWLVGTTGPRLTAVIALALAGCVGVGYVVVRSLAQSPPDDPAEISRWHALLLGLAVGVPLGVPGVIAARIDALRRERRRARRRERTPTKDERKAYAEQLLTQIRDVSPRPRELRARVTGDGGRVLRFEGDIDAREGERLTAALREDLKDVGFDRVEGQAGAKEWWSRV